MKNLFPDDQRLLDTKNYVVNHLNNNEWENCCADNLHILSRVENTAKGNSIDIEISQMRSNCSIVLKNTKGLFYMKICFNIPINLSFSNVQDFPIFSLTLELKSYNFVINCLDHIKLFYNKEINRINFSFFKEIEANIINIYLATLIDLTEKEKEFYCKTNDEKTIIIKRNGEYYISNNMYEIGN